MIDTVYAVILFAILKWVFHKLFDTTRGTESPNKRSPSLGSPDELQTDQQINER